jgi:competence protein ComFC
MFFHLLTEFFFPSSCAVCGKILIPYRLLCCENCFVKLQTPSNILDPENFPDRAIYWDSLASCMKFDKLTSRLIHAYKSGKRKDLVQAFAKTAVISYGESIRSADVITSVPPSAGKNKKRGFDPAGEIARNIASLTQLYYTSILTEKDAQGEQKLLGQEDRFIHSIGRFEPVMQQSLSGKKIVLVDDVVTTGATINECARILKKMGAAHVFSLTVAQVDIKKIEKSAL